MRPFRFSLDLFTTRLSPRFRLWMLLLLTPLLTSCMAAPRPLIFGADEVGTGAVIVVGKVKMTPPLHKGEQRLDIIGGDDFKNKFLLLAGDQWRNLETPIRGDDYKGRIEAPLDQTFFAASAPEPFYILGGAIALEFVGSQPSYAYFPGGWKVVIHPGDRAVYIGTIHYYRNEFFDITRITMEDEYNEAQALYAKGFGGGILRKAYLVSAKDN